MKRGRETAFAALVAPLIAIACSPPSVEKRPVDPAVEQVPIGSRDTGIESDADELASGLLPGVAVKGVDLRMRIDDRMAHWGVPAVGVAVLSRGRLRWAKTWGVLRRGSDVRADVETAFQAASISKPVTAVAVLRLVEAGAIDLDADVNAYLQSWKLPPHEQPITIRELLSHTAGINAPEQTAYIDPQGGLHGYLPGAALPSTADLLAGKPPAMSGRVEIASLPGVAFSYSGGGYLVLQMIIEDVTGEDFARAMDRLVLEPLGMTHSTFDASPRSANAASAHAAGGSPVDRGYFVVAEKSAGGLWTTPSDLALFLADLMASYEGEPGRLLSPWMTRTMMLPVADARPLIHASMGLGMFVSDSGDDLFFSHNGHNPGFRSTVVARPSTGDGVIVMMNREDGAEIASEILFGVGAMQDWPARSGMRARMLPLARLGKAQLDACAGSYRADGYLAPRLDATFRTRDNELVGAIDGREETLFYPIGPADFIDPLSPTEVRFDVTGNAAKSVTVHDHGRGRSAERAPR
jgi:CubicO group peptidase (beta-lactamase class C family)